MLSDNIMCSLSETSQPSAPPYPDPVSKGKVGTTRIQEEYKYCLTVTDLTRYFIVL